MRAYTTEKENIELRGRHRIYSDEYEVTPENVIGIVQDALMIHEQNREEIAYLLRYEKGCQPLKREKIVRSEINIEVVDNVANQVTEFKLGYNWGNPSIFIQRGNKDIANNDKDVDDDAISMLNEMNDAEAAFAKDQELARFVEVTGIGHQFVDIKRRYEEGGSVFDLETLNPLTSFVVHRNDIHETPLLGVTYRQLDNGTRYFTCISKDRRYEIRDLVEIENGEKVDEKWEFGPRSGERNPLGEIPIVEFVRAYDRMGCFERQIPDMDALNIEVSDFANAVAQDTQGMYWGNDFEFPKDASGNVQKPVSGQWIMTRTLANGTQPKIQPLQSSFDYSGVQQNIESKRNLILQKCYVPLQTDPGGGSTASAMSMSSGWTAAENAACKEEQIIRRAKMQIAKLELIAIQRSHHLPDDSPLKGLKLSDIAIKFTRLKTYDLGTKTNSMVAMLKAGINGRVAMQTVDLFPDVAQAWEDSKETIEKFQKSLFEKKEAPDTFGRNQSDSTDQTGNSPILDGMRTGGDDDAE